MNNTHTQKKNYDLYKIDLQLFANNKLISLDGLGSYLTKSKDIFYQDKFLIDNSNLDYCEQMLYYNDFWGSSDGTPNVLSYRIKTKPNNLSYNEQNNYYELNINVIPFESTITP